MCHCLFNVCQLQSATASPTEYATPATQPRSRIRFIKLSCSLVGLFGLTLTSIKYALPSFDCEQIQNPLGTPLLIYRPSCVVKGVTYVYPKNDKSHFDSSHRIISCKSCSVIYPNTSSSCICTSLALVCPALCTCAKPSRIYIFLPFETLPCRQRWLYFYNGRAVSPPTVPPL